MNHPRQAAFRPARAPPVALRQYKISDKTQEWRYIFGSLCAVSPNNFPPNRDGSPIYIRLVEIVEISGRARKVDVVLTAQPLSGFPDGHISLSEPQRTWLQVGQADQVFGELYDGKQVALGAMDVEVGFARPNKIVETPFDQDELADLMYKAFPTQIFQPGQRLLLDVRNIPLAIQVRTVTLMDLDSSQPVSGDAPTLTDPTARGRLTNMTSIGFFKSATSPLKLKGSSKRPAANAIIRPDFKFEDLGIGGLDAEFTRIFRRAFSSRILPPNLLHDLNIMHVKGMLLYGPPGTGKTLIARQIGKMLNAREPKVINGPEVLNKYVGQSEENIRKLFADAEKESKEKGEESGLHIIIFDELDAVCKQRGSGAGGGTGVGDSVVNQLLSKLDGVDQLNNILLIGMTNRRDMIDDALLRPGRLELQIEISLPDEPGRLQILNIHTAKMRKTNKLSDDVDLQALAAQTKNFSGADISGLVRSATSFATSNYLKAGTSAAFSEDVINMKVSMQDFINALGEVRPAFGTDDAELEDVLKFGIIHFSPHIDRILSQGARHINDVRSKFRLLSVLLYGPPGSGKTALAAHIVSYASLNAPFWAITNTRDQAMKSEFPLIKLITPVSLVGFRDEASKKDYIEKVFADAYKSPLSLLILGTPPPSRSLTRNLTSFVFRPDRQHDRVQPHRPPFFHTDPPDSRHAHAGGTTQGSPAAHPGDDVGPLGPGAARRHEGVQRRPDHQDRRAFSGGHSRARHGADRVAHLPLQRRRQRGRQYGAVVHELDKGWRGR